MTNKTHEIGVYMDDIPMRLSDRFRPIDVSAFTDQEIVIPDLFDQQYTFSAELMALEMSEMRQKQRLKQISHSMKRFDLKSDNNFKQNESEFSQTKTGSDETKTVRQTVNSIHLNPGEILKPLSTFRGTIGAEISDNNCCKSDINIDPNVSIKRKLVKDFESDTSSPFDFVELQTIDYMQELNDVFRVQNKSNQTKNSINETNCKSDENIENKTNCEQNQNPNPNPSAFEFLNGTHVLAHPYGSDSTAQTASSSQDVPNNWMFGYYQNTTQSTGSAHYNSIAPNHLPDTQHNLLRSSKSASDLPSLVNSEEPMKTTKTQRSHTPPCASAKMRSKKYIKEKQTLVLNDPYEELSQHSKEFVQSISSMGFERSRVARAVKHIDYDHKKILDFLLQVQTLEESGYDCCEAEIALHMNDYHILNAKSFLESLRQLSEVGFDKKDIIKALVNCNNDRDRALDILVKTD